MKKLILISFLSIFLISLVSASVGINYTAYNRTILDNGTRIDGKLALTNYYVVGFICSDSSCKTYSSKFLNQTYSNNNSIIINYPTSAIVSKTFAVFFYKDGYIDYVEKITIKDSGCTSKVCGNYKVYLAKKQSGNASIRNFVNNSVSHLGDRLDVSANVCSALNTTNVTGFEPAELYNFRKVNTTVIFSVLNSSGNVVYTESKNLGIHADNCANVGFNYTFYNYGKYNITYSTNVINEGKILRSIENKVNLSVLIPYVCTPINGGWSSSVHGEWSTCNLSGQRSRILTQTCNNPAPNECGQDCTTTIGWTRNGNSQTKLETESCLVCNEGETRNFNRINFCSGLNVLSNISYEKCLGNAWHQISFPGVFNSSCSGEIILEDQYCSGNNLVYEWSEPTCNTDHCARNYFSNQSVCDYGCNQTADECNPPTDWPTCSVDYLALKNGTSVFNINRYYFNKTGDFDVWGSANANSENFILRNIGYNRTSPNKIYYSWRAADNQGFWKIWKSDQVDLEFVEGNHTICCVAESQRCSGNNNCELRQSNASCSTFCIDTRAPEISFTNVAGMSNWNSSTFNWSWNVEDEGCAGIDYYNVSVRDSNGSVIQDSYKYSGNSLVSYNLLSNHTYILSIYAIDKAGNSNNGSKSLFVNFSQENNSECNSGENQTLSCSVGVGACARTGVQIKFCNNSIWGNFGVCSAVAGLPSLEKCNDIDDDCDGQINEGLNCDDSDDDHHSNDDSSAGCCSSNCGNGEDKYSSFIYSDNNGVISLNNNSESSSGVKNNYSLVFSENNNLIIIFLILIGIVILLIAIIYLLN